MFIDNLFHIALWILISFFLYKLYKLAYMTHAPRYRGKISEHFNGKKFSFPIEKYAPSLNKRDHDASSLEITRLAQKYQQKILKSKWEKSYTIIPQLYEPTTPEQSKSICYTLIGHATVLVEWHNLKILIDPIFSEMASPFSFWGPKRFQPCAISIHDIPKIDVILISHNHYDHMDIPTLKYFKQRDLPLIITGLGNKKYLQRFNINNVHELDWWQKYETIPKLNITFVPSKHWSSRGFFDKNRSLWGGFIIEHNNRKIYYAGDSGYHKHFQEIGTRYAPIDLAFFSIGSYTPNKTSLRAHLTPENAVKAHLDVQAKKSVGIHFGIFQLSLEGIDQPIEDLKNAKKKFHITDHKFTTRPLGTKNIIPIDGD